MVSTSSILLLFLTGCGTQASSDNTSSTPTATTSSSYNYSTATPTTSTGGVFSVGKDVTGNLPSGAKETKVDAGDSLTFSPASITVHVGDVVTWTDSGSLPHTVTAGDPVSGPVSGSFNGNLNQGQSFSVQFTTAGTYTYYCQYHGTSGMKGTVVVQ